jgi:hypothetical protein
MSHSCGGINVSIAIIIVVNYVNQVVVHVDVKNLSIPILNLFIKIMNGMFSFIPPSHRSGG